MESTSARADASEQLPAPSDEGSSAASAGSGATTFTPADVAEMLESLRKLRCYVCDWPLKPDLGGCRAFDCSERPSPNIERSHKAHAMAAALRTAAIPITAWRSMDTAPKDGTDVLVALYVGGVWVVHKAWYRDGSEDSGADGPQDIGWWSYTVGSVTQEQLDGYREPRLWMPCPELPND